MTVKADDGPMITIGTEVALGTAGAVSGGITGAPAPYVSGSNENPDAGPNAFYAGNMFKDPYYRYRRGGGAVQAGGYPNQALGFVDHQLLTIDLIPSAIAVNNIAVLAAPATGVPMVLVAVAGAGITPLAAAFTVLNTGLIVPAGALRIDANPTWSTYGASGAMRGWAATACGRAVSLTSAGDLHLINFTVKGWDIYGNPMTQVMAGPNGNTVNSLKAFGWIGSITPNGVSATTISVGTADIFGFPLLARRFSQTEIWWNDAAITANTGFVTADVTVPSTGLTGDVRGTYAAQTASDGVKRLVITQRILPADLTTLAAIVGQPQV